MPKPRADRRALYLRWRPTNFADVVGQEHVVRTLRNAVNAGSTAHAYLFAGPRGTGKTSVARILFRALNCPEPRLGDPCGTCATCLRALEGRALDLVEIDAASNRGIDDIRDLRDKVGFSPSDARYRVYIVDEAHELTAPAWDAFLKTLEEPPPHAVFVLATTEAHRIPATIVSRCQRFDFRRITTLAIVDRLTAIASEEGIELGLAAAERLARMARGGLRDAISLLDQAASFSGPVVDLDALREVLGTSDPRTVHELIESVARADAAAMIEALVKIVDNGTDIRLLAEDLIGQLRGLVCARVGATAALRSEFSDQEREWLTRESERWDLGSLKRLIQEVADGLARLRDGGQFQLHLELSLLGACADFAREPSTAPERPAAVGWSEPESYGRAVPTDSARMEKVPDSAVERERLESRPGSDVEPVDNARGGDTGSEIVAIERVPLGRSTGATRGSGEEDLEMVRGQWPRVIEWIAGRNAFVASYLRPAELLELRDDCLLLTFAYKVHFERVAETRNRSLVEQACGDVLGRPFRVECRYAAPLPASTGEVDLSDPVLKFALERFGGRAEVLGA